MTTRCEQAAMATRCEQAMMATRYEQAVMATRCEQATLSDADVGLTRYGQVVKMWTGRMGRCGLALDREFAISTSNCCFFKLNHLGDSLGMKLFHLRWIPNQLAEQLRASRIQKCQELISLLETMEANKFHDILTGDESCSLAAILKFIAIGAKNRFANNTNSNAKC
jgi:hypothetical protein